MAARSTSVSFSPPFFKSSSLSGITHQSKATSETGTGICLLASMAITSAEMFFFWPKGKVIIFTKLDFTGRAEGDFAVGFQDSPLLLFSQLNQFDERTADVQTQNAFLGVKSRFEIFEQSA